jgi:hypothetical protein
MPPKDDNTNQSQINEVEKQTDELLRRVDTIPKLDPRTPDEILDYDENGLPR